MRFASILVATLAGLLGSCGSASRGTGTVEVELQAESTITDGLDQGAGEENTKDYAVRYTKYLIVLGDVVLTRSGEDPLRDDSRYLVDLMKVGEAGTTLVTLPELAKGQWDGFSFSTPRAQEGLVGLAGVSDRDVAIMVDGGFTYWLEGRVERPEAEGGPVQFVLQVPAATRYDHCTHNGQPGVAVVEHGTTSALITIHGDHPWFNSFPTGSEVVERRSAWLLAADEDGDGMVHTDDLKAVPASEVFTSSLGYSLDGAPSASGASAPPIDTAYDWLRAQLSTQGHFEGEGECLAHLTN